MAFLRITGSYRVTGTEPDGDSIRFVPDDPAQWARVPGPNRVRVNSTGGAQLRLDAIDALETHYTPLAGSRLHQPLTLAHAARDELLSWLGFRDVVRTAEKITAVAQDGLPGFVLTGARRPLRALHRVRRPWRPACRRRHARRRARAAAAHREPSAAGRRASPIRPTTSVFRWRCGRR